MTIRISGGNHQCVMVHIGLIFQSSHLLHRTIKTCPSSFTLCTGIRKQTEYTRGEIQSTFKFSEKNHKYYDRLFSPVEDTPIRMDYKFSSWPAAILSARREKKKPAKVNKSDAWLSRPLHS